jgi:23S rRNA pseudouridine1911/1915/1917 synthase
MGERMDTSPRSYTVPSNANGQTLYAYLTAALGDMSPVPVSQLIERGGVWHQKQRLNKLDMTVRAGMELALHFPPDGHYTNAVIEPGDILYEDEWLLALNKRAGWYTAPTPWDQQGTIVVALVNFFFGRGETIYGINVAHQLDHGTSGVLLCIKSPQAYAPLQRAFRQREIEKIYQAWCIGEPREPTFEVQAGHGRKRGGLWTLYPLDEVGRVLPNGKRVPFSHTSFAVERRLGDSSLLRAILHTGRTHQIRLHLASVGHPLIGDTRYDGPASFRQHAVFYPMLHAHMMQLNHPITGDALEIEAPLPHRFTMLHDALQ